MPACDPTSLNFLKPRCTFMNSIHRSVEQLSYLLFHADREIVSSVHVVAAQVNPPVGCFRAPSEGHPRAFLRGVDVRVGAVVPHMTLDGAIAAGAGSAGVVFITSSTCYKNENNCILSQ